MFHRFTRDEERSIEADHACLLNLLQRGGLQRDEAQSVTGGKNNMVEFAVLGGFLEERGDVGFEIRASSKVADVTRDAG